MDKSQFSKNLIKLRQSKGMSQENLASQLFLTRQSISKWENDESVPDLNSLLQLSEVLNVSLDELVLGTKPISTAKKIGDKLLELLEQGRRQNEFYQDGQNRQEPIWKEYQRAYQRPRVRNGWEFLAKYYWVLYGLIGLIAWIVFKFYGKSF